MGKSSVKHYFECDCGTDEHIFCITSEEIDSSHSEHFLPGLYFHIQMNQYRNVFSRIFQAVKYVFGFKSKYGHWDVISVSEDDLERMIVLMHQHRAKLLKIKSKSK